MYNDKVVHAIEKLQQALYEVDKDEMKCKMIKVGDNQDEVYATDFGKRITSEIFPYWIKSQFKPSSKIFQDLVTLDEKLERTQKREAGINVGEKSLIANDGRTFKLEDYEMLLPEVMQSKKKFFYAKSGV